ncbi:MAG: hypothetical protein IT300_11105 [Dehalococcoidia bacterium]|nr:hypothetical protein [Dehalococcoidia bacterium]
MAVYHQMGYQSENLLAEPQLAAFSGAILSPVDYDEPALLAQIRRRQQAGFECVLDPQLYYPNTFRAGLQNWDYFPTDVETADTSSATWWSAVVSSFLATAERLGVRAACSPAIVPRIFNLDYLRRMVDVGSEFTDQAEQRGIESLQTVIVPLAALQGDGALAVASVAASGSAGRVFLVLLSEVEPRRELEDAGALAGGLRLIDALTSAGIAVTVGFCSTDVILYRAAGAAVCATGKFFNLRRFTGSRFDEPSQGGRQLSYFYEEGLVAFLRDTDLLRLQRAGFGWSAATQANPYTQAIFDIIAGGRDEAWLALGWKQYMWWFADVESRVTDAEAADTILAAGESGWLRVEAARPRILMDELRNTGAWLRRWRQALSDAEIL